MTVESKNPSPLRSFIHKVAEELTAELFIKVIPIIVLFGIIIGIELLESKPREIDEAIESVGNKPAWARFWYLEDGYVYYNQQPQQLVQGSVILDARNPEYIKLDNMPDGPLVLVLDDPYSADRDLTGVIRCTEHGLDVCPVSEMKLRLHNEISLLAVHPQEGVVYELLFVTEDNLGRSHTKLASFGSESKRL